jgi:hypothetical protein
MKDFFRSRLQQFVQRNDAATEDGASRCIGMCSHPKFGARSPVQILIAQQRGNEFRIAPRVMLYRGFQGEDSRMAPIANLPVPRFGFLTDD